jgi:hypothetical protein
MRGSLDDLLARLMRNEGFSLVYSVSAPGRVERIVLTGVQPSRTATDWPATRDGRETSTRSAELPRKDQAEILLKPMPMAVSSLHVAPAQGMPVPTADAHRSSGDAMAVPSAIVPATQGLPTPSPIIPSSIGLFSAESVPTAGVGEHHAIGSHPK